MLASGTYCLSVVAVEPGKPKPKYPGGSRERVSRAGSAIRERRATADDYKVVDIWRAAHRHVLNSFQALLRNRTRGKDIVVAQRHKRRSTIFNKMHRYPKMMLHRMDDVAGCRLIFPDIDELYKFRRKFHAAKFRHSLINDAEKYDYIKRPKADGYRGIHDVYRYDVNSIHGADLKGLQIELQYRTIYQHAWATCVEVVGLVTKSNPKFKKGDKRYEEAMALASEIISRAWEDRPGPYPFLSNQDLIRSFIEIDRQLGMLSMLRKLNSSASTIKGKSHNIILIFSEEGPLEIRTFRDATLALQALFTLEYDSNNANRDIVLVRGNRHDVRTAFKNYFSDATDFITYMDSAIKVLSRTGATNRRPTDRDLQLSLF